MMNADQFNALITNLQTLTTNIDGYGQQTAQLTTALEKPGSVGASTSLYNLQNKLVPKLSMKLPVYQREADENVHMQCQQLQVIFKTQGITVDTDQIHYASTVLEGAALY